VSVESLSSWLHGHGISERREHSVRLRLQLGTPCCQIYVNVIRWDRWRRGWKLITSTSGPSLSCFKINFPTQHLFFGRAHASAWLSGTMCALQMHFTTIMLIPYIRTIKIFKIYSVSNTCLNTVQCTRSLNIKQNKNHTFIKISTIKYHQKYQFNLNKVSKFSTTYNYVFGHIL